MSLHEHESSPWKNYCTNLSVFDPRSLSVWEAILKTQVYTLIQRTCANSTLSSPGDVRRPKKKLVPNKTFHVPPVASNNREPLQVSGYCKSYTSGGSTKTTFFFWDPQHHHDIKLRGSSQNLQFVQPNCNSTLPHGKHTKHRHLLFPNMQLTFQLRQFDAKCTRLLWSFKWRHGWSISWMRNMVPNQKWWVQKNPPKTYDHVIILGKNSDTRRFADFISMEWETVRKSMMVWLMDEITSQMGTLSNHVSVLLHPTCCFSVAFWYYQLVVTVCDFNHNLPLPDLLETSTSLETFIFWEAKIHSRYKWAEVACNIFTNLY